MKNFVFLSLFLFCGSSSVFSQNGFFEKQVVPDYSARAVFILDVLVDDDTIVYYGLFVDSSNYSGMFFSKMDTIGNLIAYKEIKDTSVELSTSDSGKLVKTVDGYAIQGTVGRFDSLGYYQETYMIKVNHDLDLEFLKFYPFPQFASLLNFSILAANNGFYLFGTQHLPDVNDGNWFVMKTNAQGDLLWKKSYFLANTRDHGDEMFWLDENTIVLFGPTGDDLPPGGQGNHFAYPRILAIDTFGNIKWNWNWNGDEVDDLTGGPIMATADGGYVYGSAEVKWQQAGNVFFKPVVIKLDADFQEEWRRYIDTMGHDFGEALLTSITMSKDSNYIVSGGLQLYIYHGEFSPEGDRIWASYDSTWVDWQGYEEAKVTGTDILSSGSIISGGEMNLLTDDGVTTWGFIMKLSPDGCMDTLACWPVSISDDIARSVDYQLNAYPNPASDVVHFSLPDGFRSDAEARIIITDILGRRVDEMDFIGSEVSLGLGGYVVGVYFYRLEVDGVVLDVGKLLVK